MSFKDYDRVETTRMMTLKGKEIEVRIIAEFDIDYGADYGEDFDNDDDRDSARKGEIVPYNIRVTARLYDEEGMDHLGNCYVKDMFDLYGVMNDHQMVEIAMEELKKNILDKYKLLHRVLGEQE